MRLPESFTTVTPFSKNLALVLFTLLPILSFYAGIQYQKIKTGEAFLDQPYLKDQDSSSSITPFIIPDVPSGDIADNAHLNNQQLCTNFESVIRSLEKSELATDIFDSQERTDHNTSAMSVYFRRIPNEPYITLNSEHNISKFLRNRSVEEIYEILKGELDESLVSQAFKLNTLNTISTNSPIYENIGAAVLSYTNQSQNLIFTFIITPAMYKVVNNEMVDLPADTIEVNITCTSTEPKLTALYDDLMLQRSLWLKEFDDKTLVSVWKNQDSVVNLNIASIEGSGSGLWLTKENGLWTIIAKGQDIPECTVFENRNIGKGFDCFKSTEATNNE